ncbi:hypothetical protein HDV63DRAFT_108052 [Trichoderma sp. SZMC 28014]
MQKMQLLASACLVCNCKCNAGAPKDGADSGSIGPPDALYINHGRFRRLDGVECMCAVWSSRPSNRTVSCMQESPIGSLITESGIEQPRERHFANLRAGWRASISISIFISISISNPSPPCISTPCPCPRHVQSQSLEPILWPNRTAPVLPDAPFPPMAWKASGCACGPNGCGASKARSRPAASATAVFVSAPRDKDGSGTGQY